MEDKQVASEKADVQAALGRIGGERRFVVQNVGEAVAQDVHFTIESVNGKNSPVVAGEHEKKFPVSKLEPGESESLLAIITPGTGLHFRAFVRWRDPDGSSIEKVFDLSV